MDEDKDQMPGVLWGAKAIAAYIKQTPRQTYYLLESGQLPAQRLGQRWVTTKARIRAHLNGQTLQ